MGSFIRIRPGIEKGEPSVCGGAPRAVIPGGILKCRDPACTHPKTLPVHSRTRTSRGTKFSTTIRYRTTAVPVYTAVPVLNLVVGQLCVHSYVVVIIQNSDPGS
jgi:hypothetical protein